MNVDRPGVFSQNIVSYVAYPEFEANCVVLLGERTGEDICGSPLVVGLHDEFYNEGGAGIVVRNGDENLTSSAKNCIGFFQKRVAARDHLVLFESVTRDISVPARLGAFADFEESDSFYHYVWNWDLCKYIRFLLKIVSIGLAGA